MAEKLKIITTATGADLSRLTGKALVFWQNLKRKAMPQRKFTYEADGDRILITGDVALCDVVTEWLALGGDYFGGVYALMQHLPNLKRAKTTVYPVGTAIVPDMIEKERLTLQILFTAVKGVVGKWGFRLYDRKWGKTDILTPQRLDADELAQLMPYASSLGVGRPASFWRDGSGFTAFAWKNMPYPTYPSEGGELISYRFEKVGGKYTLASETRVVPANHGGFIDPPVMLNGGVMYMPRLLNMHFITVEAIGIDSNGAVLTIPEELNAVPPNATSAVYLADAPGINPTIVSVNAVGLHALDPPSPLSLGAQSTTFSGDTLVAVSPYYDVPDPPSTVWEGYVDDSAIYPFVNYSSLYPKAFPATVMLCVRVVTSGEATRVDVPLKSTKISLEPNNSIHLYQFVQLPAYYYMQLEPYRYSKPSVLAAVGFATDGSPRILVSLAQGRTSSDMDPTTQNGDPNGVYYMVVRTHTTVDTAWYYGGAAGVASFYENSELLGVTDASASLRAPTAVTPVYLGCGDAGDFFTIGKQLIVAGTIGDVIPADRSYPVSCSRGHAFAGESETSFVSFDSGTVFDLPGRLTNFLGGKTRQLLLSQEGDELVVVDPGAQSNYEIGLPQTPYAGYPNGIPGLYPRLFVVAMDEDTAYLCRYSYTPLLGNFALSYYKLDMLTGAVTTRHVKGSWWFENGKYGENEAPHTSARDSAYGYDWTASYSGAVRKNSTGEP